MRLTPASLFGVAALISRVHGAPSAPQSPYDTKKGGCPPFKGDFTIHQYRLYPENVDFDFNSCLLYIGSLWNSTLAIYDPYAAKMVDIVRFEGIAENPAFHLGGVGMDYRTGLLSVLANSWTAFTTGGQDISGTSWIMQYNPKTKKTLYKSNLTEISQGIYGGPQDVEQDPDGNTYTMGTFPSSILKTTKKGKTSEWYLRKPTNHSIWGYSGLAAKDWTLVVSDEETGGLFRFDLRKEKGTPIPIPLKPDHKLGKCDAAYMPRKYKGTVLLVAELASGISVYQDKKGEWDTAAYKGIVPWTGDAAFNPTASVQIGDSIYMSLEAFADPVASGQLSGNRVDFPFPDITKKVEALLAA